MAVSQVYEGHGKDDAGEAVETCNIGDAVGDASGCNTDDPRNISERCNTAEQCDIAQVMEGLGMGSQCSNPGDSDEVMQSADDPYDFASPEKGVSHTEDMAVEEEMSVEGKRVNVPGGSSGLEGRVSGARTSGEPALEVDERLHRYWATGAGMCRDAYYNAMKAGGVTERMEKLLAGRDAYAEDVKNRELAKLRAVTLPPRPVEPAMVPGLYHLRSVGAGVPLPWKWEHHSGDEFVRQWDAAFPTDDFKGVFYSLYGWWNSMKKVMEF